jgi:S-layer family protein
MNQRGVDLPIICTESGLTSSTNFSSSEALQARYLPQMFIYSASAWVQSTVWYLNRDFVAQQPGWEVFSMSGLTHLDNTTKPAFTAMQVLSREVGSGAFMRPLGPNDGVTGTLEGYRFRRPSGVGQVSVVWNNGTGQVTLTVPQADAQYLSRAVGLTGQVVPTSPGPNGSILVSVGPDPVYLELSTPRFDDVPFDSWMYTFVEYLASRNIISGYGDGTFRPGNLATRGQFSKMTVLGMGWPLNTTGGPHFRDVPTSNAFYAYIETAYNRGIITGYSCGGPGEPCPGSYFRPGNNITRAQIAKIVVLAKGWTLLNPSTPTFTDVPTSSPFYQFVETAVSKSIVSGYGDHTFRPGNNATRAQLSKMLALALQQP